MFSEYLEIVHVTEHRKALCRLIVSSHQLRIETGRWERPSVSREMRHCELCNTDVEDEFHFMLKCPVYASIRKQLINGYYWRRPSMYKLVKLFNTTKRKEIIALAKYVYQAFKLRRELIAVNWDVLPCLLLILRPLSNLKLLLRHVVFVCYRCTDYAVLLYECLFYVLACTGLWPISS